MKMMRQINKWKLAFIGLVCSLVLLFAGIIVFLWSISSGDFLSEVPERESLVGPSFTVLTSKNDLNLWMEQELEQEKGDVPFKLYMEDFVYFESHVPVFNFTVPIEMVLEPRVTLQVILSSMNSHFALGSFLCPLSVYFNSFVQPFSCQNGYLFTLLNENFTLT
ncbi:MAG: YpmS family protein [Bacillus sp. (in: Bacteria)]|nr:YpmS family protein [Bacillus sp. (in: firmicutes)]